MVSEKMGLSFYRPEKWLFSIINNASALISRQSVPLLHKGGGGFRPIILETLLLRHEWKGKARTRPKIFRVVLGPCAQFYSQFLEASIKNPGS